MLKLSIEEIGILTGIFSAIFTGGYFLLKKIEGKRVKIREKLNTKWVNAGEVSFGTDTHNLLLELNVDLEDGEINGVVKSECILTGSTSPLCSVVGILRYKSSKIEIWHSRNGEGIFYGKATITLKNKNLIWQIQKDPTEIFPQTTTLFNR